MKRWAATLILVGACAHDNPNPQTPAAAEQQQPAAAAQPEAQAQAQAPAQPQMAPAPAPAAAPKAPPPARPKDTTFTMQTAQDPGPDTQAAERSMKSGNYEGAILAAKQALAKNERYVPAMLVMARAYFNLHKYELCGTILDTAAQIDDHNGQIYYLRGHLALAKDDKTSALAAFKAATDRDPGLAAAWNDLAAQYIIVHNFDAAAGAAQRAVQLRPNFVKALINYGSALRGLKQYDQAAQQYQAALRLDPNNADAYYNLGILYLDAEKIAQYDTMARLGLAVRQLQKYKELAASRLTRDDPADSYIAEAQKAMEREQKKIERQRKQAERDKAKGAPRPTPASGDGTQPPTPTPPEGGKPK